ncbi:MAG: hypothetical protein KDC45_15725, partial [Bacteroidetes bacterium]|nr:hypothetical protein [Bacteroidota bacterium]
PNLIEIQVDNEARVDRGIPRYKSFLHPKYYGGIFREIFFLGLPKVAVDKSNFTSEIAPDLRSCTINVNLGLRDFAYAFTKKDTSFQSGVSERNFRFKYIVELFAEEDPVPVYTNRYKTYRHAWEIPKIKELNTENFIDILRFANVEVQFPVEKPIFWSPANPYRYRMVITLEKDYEVIDQITQFVGIARAEAHEQYILFNAQPLNIKGVTYLEDAPGMGNTVSYAVMEQDVLRIKKLGANLIYFKHHPPHPFFIELCNKYGIFLFYETTNWGLTANHYLDPKYLEEMKVYVSGMIQRDRLNPSILAWGISNSSDYGDRSALGYFAGLAQSIRDLDSRPIFCTSVFGSEDKYVDYVDIINLDIRSNDVPSANTFVTRSLSKWPNRAVVCIYGAQIFANNQNGYSDPTSTKFQAKYILDIFQKLDEWKVSGGIIRSYNDYTVHRSHVYANPNGDSRVFTSGLVTYDRQERMAYDITKALYSDDQFEPIPVGSYEIIHPKTYPLVGLFLVIVFISFYRQSGRFKNSVFRSITKVLTFFEDIRESRIISIWPALVVVLLSSLTLSTMISIMADELKRHHIFDEYLAVFFVSDGLKTWLDGLAWSPEALIFQFSFLFLAGFMLLALVLFAFAQAIRVSFSFQQAVLSSFWSSSHYLLLIPAVIFFQRLLRIEFFLHLSMLLLVCMVLWHLWRLLRIVRITYHIGWLKTVALYVGVWSLVFFFVGSHYASKYDAFNA